MLEIVESYNPKVSIVIPAYNAANYLAEAIDSALAQTYGNIEIIVVNDGSKDDGATRSVALSYGDKIRYFEKENGGSSSALNMGIDNMTGEWFSWLSHDDLYMPEKVEIQIDYMKEIANDVDITKHIFFSAHELINADGRTIRKPNQEKEKMLAKKVNSFEHNGYLIAEPTMYTFHGCSCLVHKKALEEVGGLDEKLRLINDIDLWYRLYSSGYKVHYIPKALVKGRIHGRQVSRTIGFSYHNPEQDMFWNRSLDWLIKNHSNEENLFFLFGRNAYLKGRNEEGKKAFNYINGNKFKVIIFKCFYKSYSLFRDTLKKVFLKIKL